MISALATVLLIIFNMIPAPRATAQSLKVGMTSKTLFYLPFYVGQKKGFYNAENLKVELILIGRSDVQLQALIAGEINFGTLNSDSVILVNEKGGNLKVIAGVDNAAPYILVGGKAYKKIDDLKGARLGVSGLRGGATSILVDYLKSKGLQYPRDYAFSVISGGTAARLTALESGAIAAGVLGIPYSDIAIDQGFNKLGDTMELIPTYQFNGITVQRHHRESAMGGEKPRHRGEVPQSAYPLAALDSRAAGAGGGIIHERDGREAALRAAGRGLLYQKQGVSDRRLGDVRGTEGQHRSAIQRRCLERTAAGARKVRRPKLCPPSAEGIRTIKSSRRSNRSSRSNQRTAGGMNQPHTLLRVLAYLSFRLKACGNDGPRKRIEFYPASCWESNPHR